MDRRRRHQQINAATVVVVAVAVVAAAAEVAIDPFYRRHRLQSIKRERSNVNVYSNRYVHAKKPR